MFTQAGGGRAGDERQTPGRTDYDSKAAAKLMLRCGAGEGVLYDFSVLQLQKRTHPLCFEKGLGSEVIEA